MNGQIPLTPIYTQPIYKPAGSRHREVANAGANAPSFQAILDEKMVRLSHHAEVRLAQRGIRLNPDQLAKIRQAVDKAAAKGARESLLVMKDMALIVNVKNRTIVTALDGPSMKDNVFTNIDSAVVIP